MNERINEKVRTERNEPSQSIVRIACNVNMLKDANQNGSLAVCFFWWFVRSYFVRSLGAERLLTLNDLQTLN